MWRRKIRSHYCTSSPTWSNKGVRPSTGSIRAHTNTRSHQGWISPQLPIPTEESLDICSSSELRYGLLTTQPGFTDFYNLLHIHPCFCRHEKRGKHDLSLPHRRVLMQQEFKGTTQWPDNSPHIECPRLQETRVGLADTSNLTAASLVAGAISRGLRCIKWDHHNYIKKAE